MGNWKHCMCEWRFSYGIVASFIGRCGFQQRFDDQGNSQWLITNQDTMLSSKHFVPK